MMNAALIFMVMSCAILSQGELVIIISSISNAFLVYCDAPVDFNRF